MWPVDVGRTWAGTCHLRFLVGRDAEIGAGQYARSASVEAQPRLTEIAAP